MNLAVKSPVWDDLREIGSRIAEDNPDAALRFFTAAKEAFELIKLHPRIGRLRSFSLPGVRSWVMPDFQNYIVFYLPTETDVQILAVLHGARDLSSALAKRLE
jgi:toxin ParE1/3/4